VIDTEDLLFFPIRLEAVIQGVSRRFRQSVKVLTLFATAASFPNPCQRASR
jgi:hypothetical protein